MVSPVTQKLIDDFQFTTWLIHSLIDGISNEESLLQPPFEANCMNWVLGHILSRRISVLVAIGVAPIWQSETIEIYRSGSPPISEANSSRSFTLLDTDLDRTQEMIKARLNRMANSDLDVVYENDRGSKPVVEHLNGFYWHETYHSGQLEILRAFILSNR